MIWTESKSLGLENMTIEIIPPEEIKIKEKIIPQIYEDKYRESLAKKKGFKSYAEYATYLRKKRKEKLEEIGKRVVEEETKSEKEKISEEKFKIEKEKYKIEQEKARIAEEKARIKKKKELEKIYLEKNIVTDIRTRRSRRISPTEVTIYDLPVSIRETDIIKSPSFIDGIIIGLRKKHNILQKKIKNCDSNTLKDICELGKLIDIHTKDLQGIPSFELLIKDYNDIRQSFIKGCKKK